MNRNPFAADSGHAYQQATVRDYLDRGARRRGVMFWACFGAFMVLQFIALSTNIAWVGVLRSVTLGLAIGASIYWTLGVRCPKCDHRLGKIARRGWKFGLGFPDHIKYCPFCGLDFDTPRAQIGLMEE